MDSIFLHALYSLAAFWRTSLDKIKYFSMYKNKPTQIINYKKLKLSICILIVKDQTILIHPTSVIFLKLKMRSLEKHHLGYIF